MFRAAIVRIRGFRPRPMVKANFQVLLPVDEHTHHHAFGDFATHGRSHNLSAYDAAYLELAMRGPPLATLDDKLKTAAKAVGVALYGVH